MFLSYRCRWFHLFCFCLASHIVLEAGGLKVEEEEIVYTPPSFLSLKEVISQTLQYQWAIQTSELTIEAQAGLLEQATGAFNPNLGAGFSRDFMRDIQGTNGLKTHFNGRTTTSNLSVETLARLGTTYGISYQNLNTLNPVTLIPLSPPKTDNSTINLTVTQPLLRNLLYSPTTTLEKTQKLQLKAVKLQNIQNVAQAVFNSISAYWAFVGAKETLKVQILMEAERCKLEGYAEDLVKENQEGFATLYQPRADLAVATTARLQAEQNVRSTYNALLFNMGFIPDESKEVPEFEVEPLPVVDELCVLDHGWYDKYLEKIPEARTDIVASRVLIDIADLNLRSAKNSLLPELDLLGSAELINTTANGKADLFESSSFSRPEKDYTFGLSLTFPIFNDTAKGLVKQQRALKSQAIVNTNLLESQVISNFKTAYTFYNALLLEVRRATYASQEYEKTVQTELLKLQQGLSTYFFVLQLETNWQQALLNQIALEQLFAQNVAQLRLLMGDLVRWESLDAQIATEDILFNLDVFKEASCETAREADQVPCQTLPEN